MKPSDQEIVTHEARGHHPYRDSCRACVGGTGRSDAHKPVASMDCGFFAGGDDGEHTKGATPLLAPSMMIWSMPVQCKGVDDEAAIKETVESFNRLGYPELIVRSDNEPVMLTLRDAVIRELQERFGVQAIAQAPPKYDSASAGMLENAIKQVKQKVRDAVRAAGTFWCPRNRTSSTKIRFCVSWHGGERHQTSQSESANPGDCDK